MTKAGSGRRETLEGIQKCAVPAAEVLPKIFNALFFAGVSKQRQLLSSA